MLLLWRCVCCILLPSCCFIYIFLNHLLTICYHRLYIDCIFILCIVCLSFSLANLFFFFVLFVKLKGPKKLRQRMWCCFLTGSMKGNQKRQLRLSKRSSRHTEHNSNAIDATSSLRHYANIIRISHLLSSEYLQDYPLFLFAPLHVLLLLICCLFSISFVYLL
jgi:hypothetical protein